MNVHDLETLKRQLWLADIEASGIAEYCSLARARLKPKIERVDGAFLAVLSSVAALLVSIHSIAWPLVIISIQIALLVGLSLLRSRLAGESERLDDIRQQCGESLRGWRELERVAFGRVLDADFMAANHGRFYGISINPVLVREFDRLDRERIDVAFLASDWDLWLECERAEHARRWGRSIETPSQIAAEIARRGRALGNAPGSPERPTEGGRSSDQPDSQKRDSGSDRRPCVDKI